MCATTRNASRDDGAADLHGGCVLVAVDEKSRAGAAAERGPS